VRIEELSLLPAVVAEHELGEALVERRLAPVDELGRFGDELLETVETYLDAKQGVEEAARRQAVHPNTVRHRLRRYEQLTGTDLRRPEHLAEVWWALQKRSFDKRS
jgi:DNA-binding PucR family transcriptional regulator